MRVLQGSLSPDSITNDLETRFVGQRVIYYPSLTSTMEVAKREAMLGAVDGTVIIADEQTAGKGRIQRAWLSPEGNVALSVILRPGIIQLPSLIMLASLAVAHTIETVTGLKSQIKWPNDILINGRKACGILIESDVRGNIVDYTIIGIGINVNLRPSDYPEILPTATSLAHELGRDVPCLSIVQCLLVEIERLYLVLSAGESIYEEWRDRLVTLDKRVSVRWNKVQYEGIAESVNRDGSLLMRHSDGRITRIVAGDVTLRD